MQIPLNGITETMIVAEQTDALQSPDCYATVGRLSNNSNFEQKWQTFEKSRLLTVTP